MLFLNNASVLECKEYNSKMWITGHLSTYQCCWYNAISEM